LFSDLKLRKLTLFKNLKCPFSNHAGSKSEPEINHFGSTALLTVEAIFDRKTRNQNIETKTYLVLRCEDCHPYPNIMNDQPLADRRKTCREE
jgi:hypothetical protein